MDDEGDWKVWVWFFSERFSYCHLKIGETIIDAWRHSRLCGCWRFSINVIWCSCYCMLFSINTLFRPSMSGLIVRSVDWAMKGFSWFSIVLWALPQREHRFSTDGAVNNTSQLSRGLQKANGEKFEIIRQQKLSHARAGEPNDDNSPNSKNDQKISPSSISCHSQDV